MSRKPRSKNYAEDRMLKMLDELDKFEQFKELLPQLQRMLAEGKSEDEIRQWAAPFVQANMVHTALTDTDTKTRVAAGKDILDRKEGKAKETKSITHRLENLTEEQLDALLMSEETADEERSKDTH